MIGNKNMTQYSTGIFTDGGARGNPGRGGWGFVYVINDKIQNEGWGGEDYTTNNRMELTAIIEALKTIGNIPVTLFSDSNLCVQTYNTWMEGWKAKGWHKKGGVANLDLVKQLDELKQKCPLVKLQWLPAHTGIRWNEYVDRLANKY